MNDIDEVLEAYDYAETIEQDIADGKITVTLAEANGIRNPSWAFLTWVRMKSEGIEQDHRLLSEDAKIDVFSATLLKGWNATRDGKPIEPKDAADILKKNRAGRLLFREMATLCAQSNLFFQGGSKKKPSSTSSPSGTSSAVPRKRSRPKPKPAAKTSPSASAIR